jgi:hypothetical protein
MTQQAPLRVSPDGRHFVDASGQPFFWLGDTAWPLFTQYSLAEATAYLKDRGKRGFSVIQGVLAWSGGTGFEGRLPGPNASGHRPWTETPAQPDPAFFEHVDALLEIAERNHLVLAMLPAWGYFVVDTGVFDVENARAYGRWLGERFSKRPNLIWVLGGDRVPRHNTAAVYTAMARGLREGDTGAHLLTYHPCGSNSSSSFFHEEDWLDFNMIQTWTEWPRIYPAVVHDGLLAPRKPVVLAEPAYENGPEYPMGPITPLIVRREAWWAFTAGGSFTYGQDQMWRMSPGWAGTFDTPGARQMTLFQQALTARPWWTLVPDQGIFESGVSSERTLNTAMRSMDSTWGLVYLSSQAHALLHVESILAPRVRATWFNPATGEQREAGVFDTGHAAPGPFPGSASHWFSTPGHWEDAVLFLDGENEAEH